MPKLIDLTGVKFSKLTVIDRAKSKNNRTLWNCICDCGNKITVERSNLKTGNTKSCGCLQKEVAKEINTTHGKSKSKQYVAWMAMIKRCINPNDSRYKDYGGRGIKVCDRWMKFENFYKDMGERPAGTSIDRIDNNGNYEPSNCRWATRTEQVRNQRSNRNITFKGKTQCLSAWAEDLEISIFTLSKRLNKYKWSIEKTLTTPSSN